MTNILEKLFGLPKTTEKEKMKQIENIVDKIAIKHSIPQHTVREIILKWLKFQTEYLKH